MKLKLTKVVSVVGTFVGIYSALRTSLQPIDFLLLLMLTVALMWLYSEQKTKSIQFETMTNPSY